MSGGSREVSSINTSFNTLSQNIKPLLAQEALWEAYKQRLIEKDLGADFNETHWKNLRAFYQAAAGLADKISGAPPTLQPNYSRLLSTLRLLQLKLLSDDNPMKALFHHHYATHPEAYAYLNVLAKYWFSPEDAKPGVRAKKLEKLGHTGGPWQKLNCLNAVALRAEFGEKQTLIFDQPPVMLDERERPKKYHEIKPHPSPVTKLFARLDKTLQYSRVVVLEGPPGTGKTHAAHAYAKKQAAKAFWANDPAQLKQFLSYDEGCAVLIVDEVNLSKPGTWEFLRPFVGLSTTPLAKDKSIIFTKNPDDYAARHLHTLLKDIPTLPVKKWIDDDLRKFVIEPLLEKHEDVPIGSDREASLNNLLKIYRWMEENLPPNQLSLRDLEQVVVRWFSLIQQQANSQNYPDTPLYLTPPKLALQACWKEWRYRFVWEENAKKFQEFLGTFGLWASQIIRDEEETEPTDLTEYWPSERQSAVLRLVIEDMRLALASAAEAKREGAPLVKQGVLIEGESGFGKTELLKQALLHEGYVPVDQTVLENAKVKSTAGVQPVCPKRFIQFTVSGNTERDCAILEKAFDLGYAVILDELNLDPLLEGTFGQLLTGKTSAGKPASVPGFFVLASQNSGINLGRKTISSALQNRLHQLYVNPHSKEELLKYAKTTLGKYLKKDEVEKIVDTYWSAHEKDKTNINERRFFQEITKLRLRLAENSRKNRSFGLSYNPGLWGSIPTRRKVAVAGGVGSAVAVGLLMHYYHVLGNPQANQLALGLSIGFALLGIICLAIAAKPVSNAADSQVRAAS